MAVTKRTNPDEPVKTDTETEQVSRTENDAKPEGGIDSPNLSTFGGEAADDGAAPLGGKTGSEAADPAADRNSGGTQSLSGKETVEDGVIKTDPPLSEATAPTADPAVKPNMHESIPTHTIGRGDVLKTAMSGGLSEPGTEIHVASTPDFFDPNNVLDLNDPIATQIAHMQGTGIAIGEGRRVDSRTVSGEVIYNVADDGAVSKIPVGKQFYAMWLFTPGTDMIRWRNDNIDALMSGRLVRNGLPAYYWENFSTTRPPLCERTANGYKLLDVAPAE